jgi:hypothetical protein
LRAFAVATNRRVFAPPPAGRARPPAPSGGPAPPGGFWGPPRTAGRADHFVTDVINFFVVKGSLPMSAADGAESESESESMRHVIQKTLKRGEGARWERWRIRQNFSFQQKCTF